MARTLAPVARNALTVLVGFGSLLVAGLCEMVAVMLSAAKHLLFLPVSKQKQIPLPRLRDRDDTIRAFLISVLVLASLCSLMSAQKAQRLSAAQAIQKGPAAKPAASASASVQMQRNIGKAYYEQGKYPEAIAA